MRLAELHRDVVCLQARKVTATSQCRRVGTAYLNSRNSWCFVTHHSKSVPGFGGGGLEHFRGPSAICANSNGCMAASKSNPLPAFLPSSPPPRGHSPLQLRGNEAQSGKHHKPPYSSSDPFLYQTLTRVQLVG